MLPPGALPKISGYQWIAKNGRKCPKGIALLLRDDLDTPGNHRVHETRRTAPRHLPGTTGEGGQTQGTGPHRSRAAEHPLNGAISMEEVTAAINELTSQESSRRREIMAGTARGVQEEPRHSGIDVGGHPTARLAIIMFADDILIGGTR